MNGGKTMSKKYLIPVWFMLLLSPSFATQVGIPMPDISFDWMQLFRFFFSELERIYCHTTPYASDIVNPVVMDSLYAVWIEGLSRFTFC